MNWVLGVAFLDGADKASSLAVGDIVFYFVVRVMSSFIAQEIEFQIICIS